MNGIKAKLEKSIFEKTVNAKKNIEIKAKFEKNIYEKMK